MGPISGVAIIRVQDWHLDETAPVALQRVGAGHYTGSVRFNSIPEALRRTYEEAEPIGSERRAPGPQATGQGVVVNPPAAQASAEGLPANIDISSQAAISLPPQVIALKVADALGHAAAIKAFLGDYVARVEPTDTERALLKALQLELDTIANRIDEIVASGDSSVVSGAISHIKWFMVAVAGVEEVAELAERLRKLLESIGVL